MPERPSAKAGSETTGRFVGLAVRLAAAVVLVVFAASVFVGFQLSRRERERLVEAKHAAASMLADLLASNLGSAAEFRDANAIHTSVMNLRSNPEVVHAAVWLSGEHKPIAQFGRGSDLVPFPSAGPKSEIRQDYLDVIRPLESAERRAVGTLRVRLSLARENAAFQSARYRIIWFSVVIAGLLSGILILIVGRTIVTPLERLGSAARALARGRRSTVEIANNHEVGRLAQLFNDMAESIADRESKVQVANRRLQGLLDHMGQAIVVFGPDGVILNEHSRLAEKLFGERAAPGNMVLDLLYPADKATRVERDAFVEWLSVAFVVDADAFEELLSLAPREVVLGRGQANETNLELEFRRVARDGGNAIMLLATDATLRKNLERSIEAKDRELKKQVVAMRRLVAGGGQVFVRFLENARQRLAVCKELLAGEGAIPHSVVDELFRHIHTLRTEARSFDLSEAESLLSAFELELAPFKTLESTGLKGRSAEPRRALQDELEKIAAALTNAEALFVEQSPIGRTILEQVTVRRSEVERLIELCHGRDDELRRIAQRLAARPFGESVFLLAESVPRWAERAGKQARLQIDGRDVQIPSELARALGGVLGHLVRNAIAHGLEGPEERERLGKSTIGIIRVICEESADGPVIWVEDDGAGFDLAALSRAAEARGIHFTSGLRLAFEAGVTSFPKPDELAGHGMGLSAVKTELAAVGYSIEVDSAAGRGSKICVRPARAKMVRSPERAHA